MSTMTRPEVEVPAPPPEGGLRFVAIRADLMPAEVISARRADLARRRVLAGLAALLVLLVALYAASWWQTRSAHADLAGLQRQGVTLQSQTRQFGPLVDAQNDTATIRGRLQRLMVGDLSWRQLLTTLRARAPRGVTLDQVSGTVLAGAATAGTVGASSDTDGYGALDRSGQQAVGTVTIAGSARDKRAVADYADVLATIPGLSSPFVNNVTTDGRSVSFTITVPITAAALGGRYTTTTGGH